MVEPGKLAPAGAAKTLAGSTFCTAASTFREGTPKARPPQPGRLELLSLCVPKTAHSRSSGQLVLMEQTSKHGTGKHGTEQVRSLGPAGRSTRPGLGTLGSSSASVGPSIDADWWTSRKTAQGGGERGRALHLRPCQHRGRAGDRAEAPGGLESRPGARRRAARPGGALAAHHQVARRAAAQPRVGVYGAVASTGFAAGAVTGGLLVEVSWRLVFFVNVPVGVALFAVSWRLLPADPPRRSGQLDLPGALAATAGVALLVLGVTRAGDTLRPTEPALVVGAALVLLAAFVVRERTTAAPLFDLGLLKDRGILGANYACSLTEPPMLARCSSSRSTCRRAGGSARCSQGFASSHRLPAPSPWQVPPLRSSLASGRAAPSPRGRRLACSHWWAPLSVSATDR